LIFLNSFRVRAKIHFIKSDAFMRHSKDLTSPGHDLAAMESHESHREKKLADLMKEAIASGASAAALVSTSDIIIDPDLAEKCITPRCENYGLSKSCPPHVGGPSAMKKKLETMSQGIFFKINVPSDMLYSSDRRELFQLLHETGAGVERSAVKMGFANAQAYAGGSCKEIFCHSHYQCRLISEKGACRHPNHSRPSMSGFGVNVAALAKTAGWAKKKGAQTLDSTGVKMEPIFGLILIG